MLGCSRKFATSSSFDDRREAMIFFFLQYPIGFRALYEWNGRDFTVIRSIDHADRTRFFVCGKVALTARVNINTRFTLIKKIHNSFLSSIDRSVFYNASYELIYCSNYRN